LHPGAAQRSMRRASRAAQRGGSEAAPRAALRELPWCSRGRGAQIARGVIGVVVTFHYPLNHHPARLAAEHLEGFWFGWTSISRAFSVAQTCVFVAASLGVAMVVRAAPARAGAARALAGRARAVQRRRMLGFVPALGPHHEPLEAHASSWACIRSRLGRTHRFWPAARPQSAPRGLAAAQGGSARAHGLARALMPAHHCLPYPNPGGGQVTDLGNVLHLVGGTAAAFMIFFLPGLLLVNAAIIKESASTADLAALEVRPPCRGRQRLSGGARSRAPCAVRCWERCMGACARPHCA